MQISPRVTDLTEQVQALLTSLPDPASAIRFLGRLRQESPGGFELIYGPGQFAGIDGAALRCALYIFSYSNFLSEACLKNPEALWEASQTGSLDRPYSRDDYRQQLERSLGSLTTSPTTSQGVPAASELAGFRRRALIRIVLRDVLGMAVLSEITEELSNLADAILDVASRRIRDSLAARYGEPRLADGRPCGFSVISLGKLGGLELNYSSD